MARKERESAEEVSVPPEAVERRSGRELTVRPDHLYKAVGLFFLLAFVYRWFPQIASGLLIIYAAAILAVLLNAIVSKLPTERKWATALVGVLILAAVGAALYFGIPAVVSQLRSFAQRIPDLTQQLREWERWIRENTGLNVQLVGPQVEGFLRETFLTTGDGGNGVIGRARSLLEIFFVPILVFFGGLYAAGSPNHRLLNPLLRVAPRHLRPAFRRTFELLGVRLIGWIRGVLIRMLAVGILSYALYSLIGVPNALLLAIFAALTEAIPLVGPWIGGGVATAVAFTVDPTKGLWTAVAALAVQQIENNLIVPWAMSEAADIHPFVTLFALVIFGILFGFLGVLLAIPIVILIWTVVEVFWVERAIDTDEDRIEPVVQD